MQLSPLPEQVRAGRALLDWSQGKLSQAVGVSLSTVKDYEAKRRAPLAASLLTIRAALEAAGVEFTDGDAPGVKLRAPAS